MTHIGIFGLNADAENHILRIRESDDFYLTGIYDNNTIYAKELAQKYGVKNYTHPIDIIGESDVLDFINPHIQDFENVKLAIKTHRHIFLSNSFLEDHIHAQQLQELVNEAGVKVQVQNNDRYIPAIASAMEIIDNPNFIEIRRAINNQQSEDNNDLLNLMILQEINLILSFVDANVRRIQTRTNNPFSDTAQLVNIRIEFDNTCVASINISTLSSYAYRKMAIYQEDLLVNINIQDNEIEVLNSNNTVISTSKNKKTDTLKSNFKAFHNCLKKNTNPDLSLDDASVALEVMQEIKAQIAS